MSRRRVMDPAVFGPRWLGGERLPDLAAEIGWTVPALRQVLHRHGYKMTPEQVRQRQVETARRMAAANRSEPVEVEVPAIVLRRPCLRCQTVFETDSPYVRTCGCTDQAAMPAGSYGDLEGRRIGRLRSAE